MPKTFAGPFAQTPKRIVARVTTAHTALDATTNLVKAYTAGAEGAVVTRLGFIPKEAVTGSVAYLYSSVNAGVTVNLIDVKAVSSVSPSTSVAGTRTDFGYSETAPLRLQASEELWVGYSLTKVGTFVGDAMDY